jgi:hypothetical protein
MIAARCFRGRTRMARGGGDVCSARLIYRRTIPTLAVFDAHGPGAVVFLPQPGVPLASPALDKTNAGRFRAEKVVAHANAIDLRRHPSVTG